MNRNELIQQLAEKANSTQKDAGDFLDAFLSVVTENLVKGEKIVLTGFGTFEVRHRAERQGKNPRSGEEITIPAQKSPAFKAGKLLKDAVKGE